MNNKTLLSSLILIAVVVSAVCLFVFMPDVRIKKIEKKDKTAVSEIDSGKKQDNKQNNEVDVPVAEPVLENRVSFVAVGDNIVHDSVLQDAKNIAKEADNGEEFDFRPMFNNVKEYIQKADLAFINQESPFAGKENRGYTGYPNFNSPDKVGYDLMEIGFDVFNLANNHMLDRGESGYKSTVEFWKNQKDAVSIGGYENEEDYNNIRIVEKNGISIAFLSYTYGTNGYTLPASSEMVIPLCDDEEIDRQTKMAREMADVVMVSVHWGVEGSFTPNATQKRQMQIMVDNNVDVIIGTHPHVIQPIEWHDRPDGNKTLVMYSLGNFLSHMEYMKNMLGGIAGFDIVKNEDKITIENVYFIPTVSQYNSSHRGFDIFKFSEYTEELLDAHGTQRVTDPGRTLQYMRNIIDSTIDKEFLIEDFYSNT